MSSLVALGLLLFESTIWGLPRITSIAASQAALIVTSILNIHHFVIDGVIWKRPHCNDLADVFAVGEPLEVAGRA